MITAFPLPYAVTTPAGAAGFGFPVPFVFTGKIFGAEDSHVTEFVRSRTVGGVENVPMAKNWPVSCRFPTVTEVGISVSERSGSGAGVVVTVTAAVAETTDPSGFVSSAVIVVLPALTPVTKPAGLIVAMEGALELHAICFEPVTSSCTPDPAVASATNWPVCPDAEID